jgi:class 3 adenylate cyclase/tetratricopeptide (TPR) repeat protein
VAERRVCSVLFCDVVGFTSLSESRDPEAVRELLSEYFRVARTVIERYGGVVEKFIGDAVMAVWGTPAATEGDAERAVRAGLDLLDAVSELGAVVGVPGLAARAGVVTGEVAVTLGAVGEGMVAGDAVNTAARVQSAAEPGQVLADGATHRLAGGGVGFAEAGDRRVKGKAEPVRLWRATRVLSGVGGAQRVDGLEAALTGRDAELRAVRDLFHVVAERKTPRMMLVSGPAGVGKSRMGWEFEKYVDGVAAEVWWHRGRCLSYGEGVAFWALAEIVRQRLGIAEEDLPETASAKLDGGLERFIPDPEERDYVRARLVRLLGVAPAGDSGAALAREELFAGWRMFFERLAATGPVVLLVEDAQYADAGLLDFLDHLIDWTRNLPIYVLVFARPELSHARPGFGEGRSRAALTLDPLDEKSMDSLVDALVPGMPAEARAAITAQAQGLPLFAVETVRALIDRDVVQPVEGVYQLVGAIGDLEVPGSLHALLAARLDALDPDVRHLVTDAAVLGSTFPAEALIAVSAEDEPAVRAGLAELLRREVLSVSADPLSPERGSYRFTQQMLRQVAYETLSRRDRKGRHLAVAAHLRTAFPRDGEEVADVIAQHYLDALAAVPDDPDVAGLREQAISALMRAAERAERTGAPGSAASSYAAAARLRSSGAPDSADAPRIRRTAGSLEAGATSAAGDSAAAPEGRSSAGRLWEHAATAASTSANWAAAVDYADRAREDYQRHGLVRAAARTRTVAGKALRYWRRFSEARDQLTAAMEVLWSEPDFDTVEALEQLALLEMFVGSAEADRLTAEALTLGQALNSGADQLSGLLISRAIHLHATGRPVEAVAYFREAARLADQTGNSMLLGSALLNMADVLAVADPAAAVEAAGRAAELLRQVGERYTLAFASSNLAQALLMLGDWDTAGGVLDQALDSGEVGDIDYLACARAWLAALRGDLPAAGAILAGLQDMRSSQDPQDQAAVHTVEGFAAAAGGEAGNALRHAREALAQADGLGITAEHVRWAWPLATRAADELGDHAAIGELLAMLDSYQPGQLAPMTRAERDLTRSRLAARDGGEAATESLAAAISGLRELSTPYHLAHGLLDYAQHLVRVGDPGAASVIDEARDIASRLRCQPLLDRAAALAPARTRIGS